MTHQLRIKIALRSTSALAVGTGSGEGTVIDNSIMRNSQNLPYIPGSQLKGAMRSRVSQLCNSLSLPNSIVTDMFGSEFGTDAQPGMLRFAHLNAQVTPDVSSFTAHIRTSVTINRRRRIAEDKLLRTVEVANDSLVYQNDKAISGHINNINQAALLYTALYINTTWGHSKSRGLGWMEPLDIQVFIDDKLMSHQEIINTLESTGQDYHG